SGQPGEPPYHCEGRKDAGESCNYWPSECGDDFSCDCRLSDPQTHVCQTADGVCRKTRAGAGEPCNVVDGYPFCDGVSFCRLGPKQPDAGQPGTCERRVGLGGVCTGYAACLPNFRCSSTFGTGTCIELAGSGQPCTNGVDCTDELYCLSRSSTCQLYPPDGGD